MIFISGIHGVGKSYFCEKAREILGINSYSASALISKMKNESFKKDKLIADIDNNQAYLISAVKKLDEIEQSYLLDAHLCLLNAQGDVQRIDLQAFLDLKPLAIVLLTDVPVVIAERRNARDGVVHAIGKIIEFQNEEVTYAKEISKLMEIPLYISHGAGDIDNTINFVSAIVRNKNK